MRILGTITFEEYLSSVLKYSDQEIKMTRTKTFVTCECGSGKPARVWDGPNVYIPNPSCEDCYDYRIWANNPWLVVKPEWRTSDVSGIAAGVLKGKDYKNSQAGFADALEEAGCDHELLLAWLRSPFRHTPSYKLILNQFLPLIDPAPPELLAKITMSLYTGSWAPDYPELHGQAVLSSKYRPGELVVRIHKITDVPRLYYFVTAYQPSTHCWRLMSLDGESLRTANRIFRPAEYEERFKVKLKLEV